MWHVAIVSICTEKAEEARLDLVIISTAVRGTEYIDQGKIG
jgi:hypothetical protein